TRRKRHRPHAARSARSEPLAVLDDVDGVAHQNRVDWVFKAAGHELGGNRVSALAFLEIEEDQILPILRKSTHCAGEAEHECAACQWFCQQGIRVKNEPERGTPPGKGGD